MDECRVDARAIEVALEEGLGAVGTELHTSMAAKLVEGKRLVRLVNNSVGAQWERKLTKVACAPELPEV